MLKHINIKPIEEGFKGIITIPGSKSISNRALILGALSEKKVILKNMLFSDDTLYMIEGLKKLGAIIDISQDKKILTIEMKSQETLPTCELFIGNAGTAMRFLASYIATKKGEVTLTGNKRMKERPIKDLVGALENLGVTIKYLEKEGFPPIKIISKGVSKSFVEIDCSKSSQYLSSLLLSGSYFKYPLEIKIKDTLVSKPYISMTINMVKDFGGNITFDENKNSFFITPRKFALDEYTIEGDMSSASYFLGAALIGNGTITIKNFFKNSLQGDKDFLNILIKMGLEVLDEKEKEITVCGKHSYTAIDVNLNNTPDVAQTLAVIGLFAKGNTIVRDVANMRIKETDRIAALNNEISKLGGLFLEEKDGFTIIPQDSYHGATIETYDDHRMAMSLALAGLKIPGIKILNPECVSKTFPNFFEELNNIYNREE